MKALKPLSLPTVLGSAVLLSALCSFPALAGLLEKGRASGLTAGIANEQPYAYIGTDGKATGANVEVLKAVLAPLGITKIETPITDFGSLVPGLAAGRFDLIGAGLFINPSRCKVIGYSNPVTRSGGAFIVKAGNPLNLHSLKDVAANGKARLATQPGSNQVQEAKDSGIANGNVVLFDKDTEAVAALQAGRVDVVYFPDAEIISLVKKANSPAIERALPYEQIPDAQGKPTWNYHAYGLPKNDPEFTSAFNEQLAKLRASGELLKILQKYGYTENELPEATVTAEQRCSL
ncbi:ectoine/hydroxyectoine ABC transporter substrate-binding protein EhuB [Pseudomonas typographi]|uniref:Ectoine/hydroxyectoine ABC transporter substrate-binding protein EhuB n=1 Tax=Pseudomonas typographi TaxID=2715964 RepID=A0ABR7Z8S7_9PSED|nr:ectoine/hydroxyectoine ABC transporter substrate-binding protein EhuB [Pseudomonas typographi]MBD1552076.1 ectoine/hydroxyectoine ABC transporter substrate-binding protein EhuB [Pseudomonas typographi]MBD1586640.1 ectoine/hydroxyectoine ABC transporter substrate-binding protein EhuB [Pseudomonas typographi]MBD1601792.1 ectoine/hydroxyectoine ABC transporter substrate-binding protein EhuB [Pseudomonas typographi]